MVTDSTTGLVGYSVTKPDGNRQTVRLTFRGRPDPIPLNKASDLFPPGLMSTDRLANPPSPFTTTVRPFVRTKPLRPSLYFPFFHLIPGNQQTPPKDRGLSVTSTFLRDYYHFYTTLSWKLVNYARPRPGQYLSVPISTHNPYLVNFLHRHYTPHRYFA